MHEFSITQSILSIALEKAAAAQASKITRINLIIGELTGVVDECVRLYFNHLSKDTIAAEASLAFEKTPFQLRCRSCGTVFSPDSPVAWSCPGCGGPGVEITSGRECYVDSIEVE